MRLFKFGGGVLNTCKTLETLAKIIENYQNLILVISAFDRITSKLECLYFACLNNSNPLEVLNDIKNFFKNFEHDSVTDTIGSYFSILDELFNSFLTEGSNYIKKHYADLLAWGELISSSIVFAYLNLKIGKSVEFVDARVFIKTRRNNCHLGAPVDFNLTKLLVRKHFKDRQGVWITQGFIASDKFNNTALLGKEGSDYTAAIIASCLNLNDVTLYKNVPGIMTCNVDVFSNCKKIKKINFKDLQILADSGSEVVHNKAIRQLRKNNIRLLVKNFSDSNRTGTIASNSIKNNVINRCSIVQKCAICSVPINSSLSVLIKTIKKNQEYNLKMITCKLNNERYIIITPNSRMFFDFDKIFVDFFCNLEFKIAYKIAFFGRLAQNKILWLRALPSLCFVSKKKTCFVVLDGELLGLLSKIYEE